MDKFIKSVHLEAFEKEHLEIIQGCLFNSLKEQDSEIWIEIHENLKKFVFLALTVKELCPLASEILKKIFLFNNI
jgi:hypothetical protein